MCLVLSALGTMVDSSRERSSSEPNQVGFGSCSLRRQPPRHHTTPPHLTYARDRGSIQGDVARAYRWPLRRLADRVAPLALAHMVPDSLAHPSVAVLERCQSLVTRFRGPMAIVWGDRDPVLGRVRRHLERLLPEVPVTVTEAGHFLQEEVPVEIAKAVVSVAARRSGS